MSQALPDITTSIDLDVGLNRAWTLLTQPAFVAQWLGCMRYEARIGHLFYMQQDAERRAADDIEGATHCEVLELSEPHRMRFSWYLPGTPKTEVVFELSEQGPSATKVDFSHGGWDQFEAEQVAAIHQALSGGWQSFVLPGLARLAASE